MAPPLVSEFKRLSLGEESNKGQGESKKGESINFYNLLNEKFS
jgi:hypothetical protein